MDLNNNNISKTSQMKADELSIHMELFQTEHIPDKDNLVEVKDENT